MKVINEQRPGFTLVELLAVTVIIAILAGLTTMATTAAMQSARESKTQGTILKLDAAIQEIFEGYEEKFENIEIDDAKVRNFLGPTATATQVHEAKARIKLHFIRDLMRMEMPVTWTEILLPTATSNLSVTEDVALHGPIGLVQNGVTFKVEEPAVCEFYRRAYVNHRIDLDKVPSHAELLFLIVMNLNPEALSSFHDSEIGDIDGNGLYEFHDAWGTPIMFLRWAPAFVGSDKQPDVITRSGYPLGTGGTNGADWGKGPSDVSPADWDNPASLSSPQNVLVVEMKVAIGDYHDPFDETGLSRSWFLYPVVFSAGADKIDDYYATGLTYSGNYTWTSANQPILDPFALPNGMPNDEVPPGGARKNGALNHYDNIHNHRSSGGF